MAMVTSVFQRQDCHMMYGREAQLTRLVHSRARVTVVSGDLGTGKSELLNAARSVVETAVAPQLITVNRNPGALQTALFDGLGAAVAILASDESAARAIGRHLADATKRFARTRLADLSSAVGHVLLDAVRRHAGNTVANLVQDYVDDVRTSVDERLARRITGSADPDVIDMFVELATEVSAFACHRDVILTLDNLERLTDDSLRRVADLVEKLPDGVFLRGAHVMSNAAAHDRIDQLRTAGADHISLQGIDESAITQWLKAEGLPMTRARAVLRTTAGYPLYVADALRLLQLGQELDGLEPRTVLAVATEQAWRNLDENEQSATMMLLPFYEPLESTEVARYLGIPTLLWTIRAQRLAEARIFVSIGGRQWFHELRRQHLLNLLTDEQKRFVTESIPCTYDLELIYSYLDGASPTLDILNLDPNSRLLDMIKDFVGFEEVRKWAIGQTFGSGALSPQDYYIIRQKMVQKIKGIEAESESQ